ncbi:MAG: hypothetical protein HYW08_12110 [candidate division NC10 bacterium]|nr:hypothetical protein [candidate division NC10 bacterium]
MGDGLPVGDGPIPQGRLHRVAHGVPEVQHGARAGLPLVGLDDPGLDRAGPPDDFLERTGIPCQDALGLPLQSLEQHRVGDHAVLDHLGQAGAELPLRKRPQGQDVRHHQVRLVERAHQVLPLRQVHPRLAPHAAVHLGQQRGGEIDEGDPAVESRRHEPGEVPDDSPAQADQYGASIQAGAHQRARKTDRLLQGFALLPRGDREQADLVTRPAEGFGRHRSVRFRQARVGDKPELPAEAQRLHEVPDLPEQVRADVNVIPPVAEVDVDGIHQAQAVNAVSSSPSVSSDATVASPMPRRRTKRIWPP